MKSHITAIRAITVEFARQFIQPFLWWGIGIIGSLLIAVIILAVTVSAWWWLLAVPLIALGLMVAVIWVVVRLLATRLSPSLTVEQKNATKQFVTKIHYVTETIQTPYPLIMFQIIKDIITRTESGFIQQATQQSTTLRPDFEALRKLF
jgi:ABC-type bacteriocin/lantibiotic exporter with double-glycine peptidase domain